MIENKKRPSVAWHIDPFGHSVEQASINSMIGFDSFYFARIDYQDYKAREKAQKLQMVWHSARKPWALARIFSQVCALSHNIRSTQYVLL